MCVWWWWGGGTSGRGGGPGGGMWGKGGNVTETKLPSHATSPGQTEISDRLCLSVLLWTYIYLSPWFFTALDREKGGGYKTFTDRVRRQAGTRLTEIS